MNDAQRRDLRADIFCILDLDLKGMNITAPLKARIRDEIMESIERVIDGENKYADLCNCGRYPGFHKKQARCEE